MTTMRLAPGLPSGIRKVQVGVGPHNARSDWWNVDIRPFGGVDQVMDASKPWPWEDLLRFVYAEHFLEHLAVDDAVSFLLHAGTALETTGVLRLSTPSLEWVLRSHFSFAQCGSDRDLEDCFATNRAFHGWGHQFLYSKGMLSWILHELGFVRVSFHAYGESEIQELQGLELHGGWSTHEGYPSVWIVEAAKGEMSPRRTSRLDDALQNNYLKHLAGGH